MRYSVWFDQGLTRIPIIFFIENEIQTETLWKSILHLSCLRQWKSSWSCKPFLSLWATWKNAILIDVELLWCTRSMWFILYCMWYYRIVLQGLILSDARVKWGSASAFSPLHETDILILLHLTAHPIASGNQFIWNFHLQAEIGES